MTLNTSAKNNDDDLDTMVTLIRNFGHEQLINDLSYNIVDNSEQLRIMLISDTRFGSVYQQTTILNDMYLKAKDMGVKYVFLTGNVVEGVYRDRIDRATFHKSFLQYGIMLYLLVMLIQYLLGNDAYLKLLDQVVVRLLLHSIIIINSYFLLKGEKYYNENVGVE